MSGVMVKVAVYAMMRLFLLHIHHPLVGGSILVLGAISAFWGVAFALLQLGRPRDALDALAKMSGWDLRRSTLRVMAHSEMLAGSMANAAQAYQRADKLRTLSAEDSIAYAEALTRA